MVFKRDWTDSVDTVHDTDLEEIGAELDALTGGMAPYDLSYVLTLGERGVGYGENAMGVKLQRAATFTKVHYRCETADASGNLVVELRKNGSQVSGTSKSIAAASQVAGDSVTGSWAFAEGDILTVYITGVGTSPGDGLVADIKGVPS